VRRLIPSRRAISLSEIPSATNARTCAHSNVLRTSAPLARRHRSSEPRRRGGRDQRRSEWCTFRLPILAQYWTPGVRNTVRSYPVDPARAGPTVKLRRLRLLALRASRVGGLRALGRDRMQGQFRHLTPFGASGRLRLLPDPQPLAELCDETCHRASLRRYANRNAKSSSKDLSHTAYRREYGQMAVESDLQRERNASSESETLPGLLPTSADLR